MATMGTTIQPLLNQARSWGRLGHVRTSVADDDEYDNFVTKRP